MLLVALAATLAKPLVVAYVTNWDDLPTFAATVDYAKLTHIDVAFENPVDDAGNLSFNPADDVLVKTAHAHGVKVLVSIGGGSAPDDKTLSARYFALMGAAKRAGFAATLAGYARAHRFDGLDVDLEGPLVGPDYGAFVTELGGVFHRRGLLLTAALSQGYGGEGVPKEAFDAFDFVNVMAYDATGPWAPNRPGQHSSLDYAKSNVAYWLARGLPRSKTVLGVPFYGYGFGGAAKGDEWSYAKILATYPGAENLDQVGDTIWYNGVPTMRAKGAYVMEQGLAGAMIWSLQSDVPGDKSLLAALYAGLHPKG